MNFEDANGDYIESLVRDKKATVRFHVLSFLGDESVRAANASFCAADEGQYLDFHHALYAVQSPLENSGFWSNQKLIDIATKIGIKSSKFLHTGHCGSSQISITFVKPGLSTIAEPLAGSIVEVIAGFNFVPSSAASDAFSLLFWLIKEKTTPVTTTSKTIAITIQLMVQRLCSILV